MKGDYGSLGWVNDKDGHEYVCTINSDHDNDTKFEDLTEEEKKTCQDVNQIVGTERW